MLSDLWKKNQQHVARVALSSVRLLIDIQYFHVRTEATNQHWPLQATIGRLLDESRLGNNSRAVQRPKSRWLAAGDARYIPR